MYKPLKFKAKIEIIGINPFVGLPEQVLGQIFKQSGKEKGHIPVRGTVNGLAYKQTLVKYRGEWRLYINTTMLKNSPRRIGENIEITVAFDPEKREIKTHPKFARALDDNPEAKTVFEALPASRKHEIVRYLASLKTETSVDRNIARAIAFLTGKDRFVGRDTP